MVLARVLTVTVVGGALIHVIAGTAISTQPVPSMAGTLVAPRVVVAVLLAAVRAILTFVDVSACPLVILQLVA